MDKKKEFEKMLRTKFAGEIVELTKEEEPIIGTAMGIAVMKYDNFVYNCYFDIDVAYGDYSTVHGLYTRTDYIISEFWEHFYDRFFLFPNMI